MTREVYWSSRLRTKPAESRSRKYPFADSIEHTRRDTSKRAVSGIESTPGVCGGEPRIVRTRITVWILEQARRLGSSEEDLLQAYPALRADDLTNAWAYVSSHRQEIEEQIRANEDS